MRETTSSPYRAESDREELDGFRRALQGGSRIVDFGEQILAASVLANARVWRRGGRVVACAFVDDWDNLWFDLAPDAWREDGVLDEIVTRGLAVVRGRSGSDAAIETRCLAGDEARVRALERRGFERAGESSLLFARPLDGPPAPAPLPAGFTIRPVAGARELAALVALHREAFGTDSMTEDYRLAMIAAPGYVPALDLVAVAPDGELAAFCVCSIDPEDATVGLADPVGVVPWRRRKGLARALLREGLESLRKAGATEARLGTSSANLPMRALAESLGFAVVEEASWYARRAGD